MLVLFETAAGYALFKLLDEKKIEKVDNIWEEFCSAEKAAQTLKLVSFKKFADTAEALEGATALSEGRFGKKLKKLLKKTGTDTNIEQLAVGDAKLGSIIKEKLEVPCVCNQATSELMRAIRTHLDCLVSEDIGRTELNAMNLGLAHSLGRYKVKFNPEKIDTMIVQAVSLLDDLDKELNNYVMRCREWYGWHFPELGKLLTDHQLFANVVKATGVRQNVVKTDLSDFLPEETIEKVKSEAEVSMGTDISDLDIFNIKELCDQILQISSYRSQLYDYLKNRMTALAPNLTVLLGELVGARLLAHAGSLISLAKYPASTVQILGAEKALFRALKTKRDTPKYGLIYHAQLIGQAAQKYKGKLARKLAAKVSLATRIDAFGDDVTASNLGIESRAYLESQMKLEQQRPAKRISGTGRTQAKHESYQFKSEIISYDQTADSTIVKKKKKFSDEDDEKITPAKRIKIEDSDAVRADAQTGINGGDIETNTAEVETPETVSKKKKKKKKESKVRNDPDDGEDDG